MSPDFRKVALIAASLGLIVSLFFALRPDDDEDAAATTAAATTTVATTEPATTETEPPATTETEPPPATTAPPADGPVTIRIAVPSDTAPTVRRFSVRRGRDVVIVVRTDLTDHVHLHGYDLMADVGPGQPGRIEFTADTPGGFEIELEDRGLLIAELEVQSLSIVAHGLGEIQDLPIPGWLFLWGAFVVLVLSFLALGALWKRPVLEARATGRPFPEWLARVLRSAALRVLVGLVTTGLLVLVFLAALLGEPSSAENISPTFVLVLFWVGMPAVQVLFGNVWRVLNPWLAIADAAAWLWGALGRTWQPPLTYPRRLGVWPAAVALLAFAAYELVYVESANPRPLALAIAVYSYAMWIGMAAFGRREWDENGNGFTAYFGLLARIAPFGEHDGRLVARVPLSGLGGVDGRPGLLALIAVMLGTVFYDSFSGLSFWADWSADLQRPYILDDPGTADLIEMGFGSVGLLGCVLFVAGAYLAAVKVAESETSGDRRLTSEFLQSLVPIAFVYVVAHYFTFLIVQGQYAIPLASDPFGFGWDLFGTIAYAPNIAPLEPNTVWYIQVGTIVAGHVAGLAVAHDRAVAIFAARDALRSQYPLLSLMIVYTLVGMWMLTQGLGLFR